MVALQLLLNVLALGSAYAMVALGFVLILNATGAVNFSQGDLVMVGGFAAVVLASHVPVAAFLLLPMLLCGMAALGAVVAIVAYMPLRRRPPEAVFISTIAVGIILQNAANLLFGPEPRAAPPLIGTGDLHVGDVGLSRQAIATIAVAASLILALHVLFAHTPLGRRLRATAQDREMAAVLGIRVDAMIVGTFALAASLAGAAGLLLANSYFVTPADGANYILKAYIAAVIGGWGSLPGAAAGALLIAGFEVLYPSLPLLLPALDRAAWSGAVFSQSTAAILLDLAILMILFTRPRGLFGEFSRSRP